MSHLSDEYSCMYDCTYSLHSYPDTKFSGTSRYYISIKGEPEKMGPQIGHLEKRLRNGWRQRRVTLVVLHKACP
jgi:hypothetical protein